MDRHCTRANVWIATFSFIGNWWFTHYFYNVLEASYSMPAHDVNAVPWAMFLATHFYFTLYHALAAKVRKCIASIAIVLPWCVNKQTHVHFYLVDSWRLH